MARKNNLILITAALECANKSKGESRLVFLRLARKLANENPVLLELDESLKTEYSLRSRLNKEISKTESEITNK